MRRLSSLVAFGLVAGCGPAITLDPEPTTGAVDDTSAADTSGPGGAPGTVGGDPDGGPGPGSPVTSDPVPPTTGSEPGSTDDTAPGDASDDDGGCDPKCLPGEECIAGICFGEPDDSGPCQGWGRTGNYADCVTEGARACDGAACILDDPLAPTAGACAVLGCEDVCDCPDPGGMDGTVVCDVITSDQQTGCYFSCVGGSACPQGMVCLGDFFCGWSGPTPTFGSCADGEPCASDCFQDDPLEPSVAVCTEPCADVGDCPPAQFVGSVVACATLPTGGDPQCVLTCESGAACPAGMVCFAESVCAWPVP